MKRLVIILLVVFTSSLRSFAQTSFEWTGTSIVFENGVSNQVAYIDFGTSLLWGSVEVSLTTSYHYQNSTGLYRKSYNIGKNQEGGFHSNSSEVTSALGPVAEQWKLGEFEINSSNHLVLPIYHLVNNGNPIIVQVKGLLTHSFDKNLITITTPQYIVNNQVRDYNYINGKLSIGTSKADPEALFTVAGNITSKELKVKINAGADFVFHPDYQLTELQSVEEYVKTNKHLPEIPSAKEMKASGLEVGDFQIKLLQKIEELTLYLIELKKENEKMKVQLGSLEKRVKE
ncbi:hypothetical protein [Pedobacter nutrimenti]|uniref:Uncharacterized protein n=1 Tax=Pedobacter nutrimenti TaxID=1241337 RepID=A0A318UDQ0_9SPHI|nr:hypothetical protein [Pedobacter nutrimenti]PYF74203.1 hypothetical protein B0O44_104374 [Pedobacter nutrimenti]